MSQCKPRLLRQHSTTPFTRSHLIILIPSQIHTWQRSNCTVCMTTYDEVSMARREDTICWHGIRRCKETRDEVMEIYGCELYNAVCGPVFASDLFILFWKTRWREQINGVDLARLSK